MFNYAKSNGEIIIDFNLKSGDSRYDVITLKSMIDIALVGLNADKHMEYGDNGLYFKDTVKCEIINGTKFPDDTICDVFRLYNTELNVNRVKENNKLIIRGIL